MRALYLGVSIVLTTSLAQAAPQLVFSEDWEDAAVVTNKWRSSLACNQIYNGLGQAGPAPTAIDDALSCSGKILRETIGFSGGRVFSKMPVAAAAGEKYCVSVWARAGANADAYIGIQMANSAADLLNNAVGPVGEYWVAGTTAITSNFGGADLATGIAKDGQWHNYQKTFTLAANHFPAGAGGPYTNILLKVTNFAGVPGGTCSPVTGYPGQVPFDVDDIRLYKLTGADVCPAPGAGDTQHETCGSLATAGKGVCQSSGTPKLFKCVACDKNFGEAGGTAPCPTAAASICVTAGTDTGLCKACAIDKGATGTGVSCTDAANSYCKADGTCGKCASDDDCKEATKIHGGTKCDTGTGTCTNGCKVTTEAADCTNPNKPWCKPTAGDIGACADKLENGEAIPSRDTDTDAGKGKCSDASATKFCASGACDASDNKCGIKNGNPCSPGQDAKCRASACGADGKCGRPDGEACSDATECRSGGCNSGKCGAPVGGGDGGASSGGSSSGGTENPADSGGSGGCSTGTSSQGNLAILLLGLVTLFAAGARRLRKA